MCCRRKQQDGWGLLVCKSRLSLELMTAWMELSHALHCFKDCLAFEEDSVLLVVTRG